MSLFEATGFSLPLGPPAPDYSRSSSNKRRKRPRTHDAGAKPAPNDGHGEAATGPEIDVEKLLEKMRKTERESKPQPKDINKAKKKETAPIDHRDRPYGRDGDRADGEKWKKITGSSMLQTRTVTSSTTPAVPGGKKNKNRRLSDLFGLGQERQVPPSHPASPVSEISDKKRKRGGNKNIVDERSKGGPDVKTEHQGPTRPWRESLVTPIPVSQQSTEVGMTELQKKMRSKLHGSRFRWINELLVRILFMVAHIPQLH
jgi:hypothetical protein